VLALALPMFRFRRVTGTVQIARDINGREVLATHAPVPSPNLGWLVLVSCRDRRLAGNRQGWS
jgi:hypothetical protein